VLPLQKIPTTKQPTASAGDLPRLVSSGPKLQHYCNDRPRRMKTRASTRPTVGLTHTDDAIDEEARDDVDEFFTPPSSQNASTVDSGIVNGEPEKE